MARHQAGFLYLARTSTGAFKLGRTSRPLGLRERELQTADPGLTIVACARHENVILAEKQAHRHLRLVAGTAYRGPGREVFDLPEPIMRAALAGDEPAMLSALRAKVGAIPLTYATVAGALQWLSEAETVEEADTVVFSRCFKELMAIGIMPVAGEDREDGVAGVVYEPERLRLAMRVPEEALPALRNLFLYA